MDVIGVIRRKLTALLTKSIPHQGAGFGGISAWKKSTKKQCVQWLENTGFRDFLIGPVAGTRAFTVGARSSIPVGN